MNSCATGRRIHGLWKCFEMEGRIRGYGAVTGSTDRRRWRAQTAVGPRTGTATRSLRALMGSGGFDTPTQSRPLELLRSRASTKFAFLLFREGDAYQIKICRRAPATIAPILGAAHLRLLLWTRVVRGPARCRDSQRISP